MEEKEYKFYLNKVSDYTNNISNYGNRLEIKLKVLEQLIREVSAKYQENDKQWLEKYVEESMTNYRDATYDKIDEAIKCFIDLRDKK